ncbi:MAG: hypothetical protein M3P26_06495 [Gemmatimonadota bacterium]|nr:hypothetical protein [Gemmatimonadota bacterium]
MTDADRPTISPGWAALVTLGYLCGGFLGGMATGIAVGGASAHLPPPLTVVIPGIAAIAIMVLTSTAWARTIAVRLGSSETQRVTRAGALGFGPMVILIASALTLLEPRAVSARTFPIHVVYGLLFVPATFAVAAGTIGTLGIGLRMERRAGLRLAIKSGAASAFAFLIVYLAMDAAGWQVGAPEARQRATMLVVTGVSALAAAVAGGFVLGSSLRVQALSTQQRFGFYT